MLRGVLAFGPSLLIADVPASFPPAASTDAPNLYLLVFAAALPAMAGLAVNLVQYLGKRTVDREDQDKKEVKDRLKEHDSRFERTERAIDELKNSNERRFAQMDHSLVEMQGEVKHVLSVAESIRGVVTELKSGLENRFEKQADFYRSSLKEQTATFDDRIEKLEQDLRHDMTRAVADTLREQPRRGKRR